VQLWPQLLDMAVVAVPALRLCTSLMQHCCRCADLLPRANAAAPPTALEQAAATAFDACAVVGMAWGRISEAAHGLCVIIPRCCACTQHGGDGGCSVSCTVLEGEACAHAL
jgi:hypothetical protein